MLKRTVILCGELCSFLLLKVERGRQKKKEGGGGEMSDEQIK